MTRRPLFALTITIAIAAAGPGIAGTSKPRNSAPERILQKNWCAAASLRAAAKVAHGDTERRNVEYTANDARRFHRGCTLAMRVAPKHLTRLHTSTACPARPRPLTGSEDHRRAAAAAVRQASRRTLRPIITTTSAARNGQVRHQCGSRIARRTVVVTIQNTALYPSASASLVVVAVSRFRGRGWRVWQQLH